ncbi:AEC family transporter [Patescibacteria group bacterium]|nr:MAG: AEC family transporter [Patescibacteria group bacterium]
MSVFFILLSKIAPLYLLIVLGFLVGKFTKLQKEAIAPLLIYVIAPVVVFKGVMRADLVASNLSLPILFFAVGCLISLTFLFLSKFIWQDSTRNIVGFTAGTGNSGYFGLPVALAIFGDAYLPLAVLILLGMILYENSLGFYIVARGNHSRRESFLRLLKLPAIYAFFLAVIFNAVGMKFGMVYENVTYGFQLAYTVLGMMIIGLGIAGFSRAMWDAKFIAVTFLAKFIVWPLVLLLLMAVDNNYFHLYGAELQRIMILMAIVPLAANTVSYATLLKVQPEKAALAVLFSTVFALLYIPLIATLFLG